MTSHDLIWEYEVEGPLDVTDDGFRFYLSTLGPRFSFSLIISTEFTLTDDGTSPRMHPVSSDATGRLVAFASEAGRYACRVFGSGRLEVVLPDTCLSIGPDPHYEAWELRVGRRGFIALPGGGVAEIGG